MVESASGVKTLADYINWRVKAKPAPHAGSLEYRPPTMPVMYDRPQYKVFSALDSHPILQRVLFQVRVPPPRSFPIFGTPAFQFFSGLWTGAMLTMVFTCKPLGRKETEDLVKYDPAYFPEFARGGTATAKH